MEVILQKAIASSGYCSRRKAEELIKKGQVKINGEKAFPGDKVNIEKDKVTIKNKPIPKQEKKVYLRFNKPINYTCTNRKFPGEKNIFSLINLPYRLFTIGRLDKNSRGLILLTNDGSLAQQLSHPRFKHEKVYKVTPQQKINHPKIFIKKLKTGIDIGEGDGIVAVKKVIYQDDNSFLITLTEGKKRQIRRMFQALNLAIRDLKRIKFGNIGIGNLKEGEWSYLNKIETNKLNFK